MTVLKAFLNRFVVHNIGVRLGVPLLQFQSVLKEEAHVIYVFYVQGCVLVCMCVCCENGIIFILKLLESNVKRLLFSVTSEITSL